MADGGARRDSSGELSGDLGSLTTCPVTGAGATPPLSPQPRKMGTTSQSSEGPVTFDSPQLHRNRGRSFGGSSRGAASPTPSLSKRGEEPVYYHDYLCLDKLLSAQVPKSAAPGVNGRAEWGDGAAHDEHLFIVIHQVYELWFKQILHELNSVVEVFSSSYVDEKDVGIAVARMKRVTEIQRIVVSQLSVLETMTPMGFLEFRDFLFPASGFQSVQFRLIENTLGLKNDMRKKYGQRSYCTYLKEHHREVVLRAEHVSLHDLVEKWLERTPFLSVGDFNFWTHYQRAVDAMLDADRQFIETDESIPEAERAKMLDEVEQRRSSYEQLVDGEKYNERKARGEHRLSHRAMQAALLISLYQDEPILQPANALLQSLLDVDNLLTQWRHRHALMVHRMLGVKIGTGGSSGYHYLRATASQHRIFTDLFNIATFLVPRDSLPPLPGNIEELMRFRLPATGAGDEESAPANVNAAFVACMESPDGDAISD